jgi:hypothetical protein
MILSCVEDFTRVDHLMTKYFPFFYAFPTLFCVCYLSCSVHLPPQWSFIQHLHFRCSQRNSIAMHAYHCILNVANFSCNFYFQILINSHIYEAIKNYQVVFFKERK